MNDSSIFSAHLNDIINKVRKTNSVQYSFFLTLAEQHDAEIILLKRNIIHSFYGGYEEADRKILSVTNCIEAENSFPIIWIKINISDKVKDLKHSDYMGSIMALGVERCVFGDILVFDHYAMIPIISDFMNFFQSNLEKIGRTSCDVTIMPLEFIPEYQVKFLCENIIVSSTRLDCIVSALCSMSKDKSNEFIKSGYVSLNYAVCQDNTKKINENDTIVIRGFGKFIIYSFDGTTHKERLKIKVKKYI